MIQEPRKIHHKNSELSAGNNCSKTGSVSIFQMPLLWLVVPVILVGIVSCNTEREKQTRHPNIIYILADDMGYGDVEVLNAQSKIPTPNLNRLAEEGMIFTDAHSGSSVCTPTRYGILTGRYSWRSRLQSGVLAGFSPHLIQPETETVASFLKKNGYTTACIGKWHLGWDWHTKDGYQYSDAFNETGEHVDFSKDIRNGPTSIGFDYFYGISSSLDIPPYVYMENDHVTMLPESKIKLQEGYGFYRAGDISADFIHEKVLSNLTQKVCDYIGEQAKSNKPLFVYFPMTAPHTPILPEKEFTGKSGIGPYGDFVYQCDYSLGKIMETLSMNGIEENTLVIFTSDNGCSPMANFEHLLDKGHNPSYQFRGHKADIFDGGHRVPFIARWPSKISPGTQCNVPICLNDLLATTADILNQELSDETGVDSESFLDLLLNRKPADSLRAIVHHSINGSFAIRKGKWKLILCPGSGGWSDPKPKQAIMENLPAVQLYNLEQDIREQNNLYEKFPEKVNELTALLKKYIEDGRSNNGPIQQNDVPVETYKNQQNNQQHDPIEHLAKDALVEILHEPTLKYAQKGKQALTDGIVATTQFDDGNWLGVQGEDLEFVIDLGKETTIYQINVGVMQDQGSWIFLPEKIEVSISKTKSFDNPSDKQPGEIYRETLSSTEVKRELISLNIGKAEIRFIKVKVTSIKNCPPWHPASGGKAWIFVDEIVVE